MMQLQCGEAEFSVNETITWEQCSICRKRVWVEAWRSHPSPCWGIHVWSIRAGRSFLTFLSSLLANPLLPLHLSLPSRSRFLFCGCGRWCSVFFHQKGQISPQPAAWSFEGWESRFDGYLFLCWLLGGASLPSNSACPCTLMRQGRSVVATGEWSTSPNPGVDGPWTTRHLQLFQCAQRCMAVMQGRMPGCSWWRWRSPVAAEHGGHRETCLRGERAR